MRLLPLPADGWQTHTEQVGSDVGVHWSMQTTLASGLQIWTVKSIGASPALLAPFLARGETAPAFVRGIIATDGRVIDSVGHTNEADAYTAHFDAVKAAVAGLPLCASRAVPA